MLRSFVFFLLALLSSANANATDIITMPEAAMLVSPQSYNGTYINRMGDTSVANLSWIIQQTGQGALGFVAGSNYNSSPGTSWQFGTGTARVEFYAAPAGNFPENTYEFAQNGRAQSVPCSQEQDLLALAIQSGAFKDQNGNAAASRAAQSNTMDQLTTVNVQVGLIIPYENIVGKCTDANAAGYGLQVGVRSANGYFIYYQLVLRTTVSNPGNLSPCVGYPVGKIYCFSTSASTIGGPPNQTVYSNRTFYNLNLYSSVKQAISQTPDTNLADWHIEAGYFGQNVIGDVSSVSQWDSLKIDAY